MGSTRQPRIRLVMEPRHAPLKTAPRRARKKRRVMKKEVASSSTTPSSVSVAAASDGEQPPLLVPVPAGAEAFEYEREKKDIFPKPGSLCRCVARTSGGVCGTLIGLGWLLLLLLSLPCVWLLLLLLPLPCA